MKVLSLAPIGLALVFSVSGCSPTPIETDVDDVALDDAVNFAHIAASLEGGGSLTLGELIENSGDISFTDAPDPTQLLAATAVLDDALLARDRLRLGVLTYNVGLLDAKLLGFIDYKQTPLLEVRRNLQPDLVFAKGADIVLLQELWTPQDVAHYSDVAEQNGYLSFPTSRRDYNDGLAIFLREDIVRNAANVVVEEVAFAAQDPLEFFPGPGLKRGFISVRFEHPGLGDVLVANTHLQAFPSAWLERMQQSRALGAYLKSNADEDTLVLVGGDLNAGPFYSEREWSMPDGTVDATWWKNTLSYPTLLEYGGLVDLAVMARPLEESDIDVTLGLTVVNDAAASVEIPGAEDGWCDATPHKAFTASDCNQLYFEQYAGTEYPARLDHIFGAAAEGRILVEDSEITFTELETFGDVETEPSDHYGVFTKLLVLPSRRVDALSE
ncbi:MAG: hypothetical protein GY822_15400 [Deltaproteobacteria bacterium]|nr:hypothetical protein [Deltaproteobacteria bacterium]